MQITVKFSGTRLANYAAKIAALGARGEIEMARGLNDAGDVVRTQVRRALQKQMGLQAYDVVVDATSSIPARPDDLRYRITAAGKGLPIRFFGVKVDPHGPVVAMPWGVPHEFKRSFRTTRTGRLLARRTDARLPVRSLRGPSPSKELVKGQSLATFEQAVPGIVEPVIIRRLARLMP